MVAQHYRWDFIGLSTDTKPTPATSEKVTDGSTFYCSDNSKLYVWCNDQWYEKTVSGGGGTTYTAGDNIQISDDNVISATDTTYSAFVGTDGEEAGTAGLVPAPAVADADKFLKSDGTWDTAGGGGPTVVQTTGTSTTDVMSQDATTSMVYADPADKTKVKIGSNAKADGLKGIGIGQEAIVSNSSNRGIAIGVYAQASANGGIAIGAGASSSLQGEMNIGTTNTSYGYNWTNYRIITGVHDGRSLNDAATVAQGNTLSTSAPTTSTVGVLGQLYTDTTNMHTYQCTAISGSTYTWTQRW